ncbi:hypothetical protein GCM10025865_13810 [Paraoerskovia sediminicola]|uniref:DUF881 domain-containing protein n=1 Tax=Paraoerskovia sediminicola TaxID=1138587 RepID=A0ABM8G1V3_9CELL|nr:DUF881 domain-containing protein [Paraoerskovia sediminicola]BDZ42082.1 hypothetical protein GCM10025865_13810 [Paraoerskovia sediminicola]
MAVPENVPGHSAKHGADHAPKHGTDRAPGKAAGTDEDARPWRPLRRRILGGVSVFVILAVAGLMFTMSASLARGTDGRHPENLAELVESESARVEALTAEVSELDGQIERLSAADPATAVDPDLVASTRVAAGTVAVKGPGIRVALDDAPPGDYGDQFRPDDLVVHQQDLQAVINALWAGGGEAMTLQGQRVDMTTAFRCVGNVLFLRGRVYSPPFVVEAVGDPEALQDALDASPQIAVYREYVEAVKLGYKVDQQKEISMPRSESSVLEHAEPVGGATTGQDAPATGPGAGPASGRDAS